jgi:hypothetical protein
MKERQFLYFLIIIISLSIICLSCKYKKNNYEENVYKWWDDNEFPYYRDINEITFVLYGDFENAKDEINNYYRNIVENNICKIHYINMKKEDIKLISGILRLNEKEKELNELRKELFPNSNDPISSGDVIYVNEEGSIKFINIFVCDECNNERDKNKNILGL